MEMFRSGMFHKENALKEEKRHGQKMSVQSIGDSHLMQKRAELLDVGCEILNCLTDPTEFPKNPLERPARRSNYKRMLLHTFTECVC